MPSSPTAAALRANLVQSYQKLADRERELVQLYSIIYAPIGKAKLLDCLNLYFESAEKPSLAGPHLLNPLITRLNGKRLLVTHTTYGPQCHPLLVEIATRDAIHQGRFEPMVRAVQTRLPIRTHGWNQSLRYFQTEDEFLREVRIGLYRHDWDYIEQQFDAYYSNPYTSGRISMAQVFDLICNNRELSRDSIFDRH
ncbi:hypothetical protein [Leptolyngbya sp. KIOST-1]|uniref:hypothetical protein n=1 Tax=Leptolyngbya sp. KIOST-1 TaxID=1229172 RepID=UPI000565AA93|nr:hypothetical protein [Leptolyngbya sp. KIOST-1]